MFPLLLVVVLVAGQILPLFDASPRLYSSSPSFIARWDALHFIAIADGGYKYENQWAFLSGVPFLLRLLHLNVIWHLVLLVIAVDSAHTLYRLTRFHFPASPAFAQLAVFLSLFPSSPSTLYFAPYSEPFFTCMSYRGMLYSAHQHWLSAAFCFAVASTFRSNGILLAGYLIWGMVFQPFLEHRGLSPLRILYSLILSLGVSSPLVYHNISAYRLFCAIDGPPNWCQSIPPSIYTHAQTKYWNVGFLRYWTSAQIPNFVISAPPLILLIIFSAYRVVRTTLARSSVNRSIGEKKDPFSIILITPHLIHVLAMCIILVFFSHVQIVLRLAASHPVLYWAAAWLFVRGGRWGKMWICWSVLWGLISMGLWLAFLPPA